MLNFKSAIRRKWEERYCINFMGTETDTQTGVLYLLKSYNN